MISPSRIVAFIFLLVNAVVAVDVRSVSSNINPVSASNYDNNLILTYTGIDDLFLRDRGTILVTMYDGGCKTTDEEGEETSTTYGKAGKESESSAIFDSIDLSLLMNKNGTAIVSFNVDLKAITSNKDRIHDDGLGLKAFCVRFGLYDDSMEINYEESIVMMTLSSLANDDELIVKDVAVWTKNSVPDDDTNNVVRHSQHQISTHGVVVKVCHGLEATTTGTQSDNDDRSFVRGDIVSLCITPDSKKATAVDDVLLLSSIDSLTWSRYTGNDNGTLISQDAIRSSNMVSNNILTSITKQTGTLIIIDTMLFPSFYLSDGFIIGSGSVTLEFQSSESRHHVEKLRKLRGLQAPTTTASEIATTYTEEVTFEIEISASAGGANLNNNNNVNNNDLISYRRKWFVVPFLLSLPIIMIIIGIFAIFNCFCSTVTPNCGDSCEIVSTKCSNE